MVGFKSYFGFFDGQNFLPLRPLRPTKSDLSGVDLDPNFNPSQPTRNTVPYLATYMHRHLSELTMEIPVVRGHVDCYFTRIQHLGKVSPVCGTVSAGRLVMTLLLFDPIHFLSDSLLVFDSESF